MIFLVLCGATPTGTVFFSFSVKRRAASHPFEVGFLVYFPVLQSPEFFISSDFGSSMGILSTTLFHDAAPMSLIICAVLSKPIVSKLTQWNQKATSVQNCGFILAHAL